MTSSPTTVAELAAGIAEDIRHLGHYQGQLGQRGRLNTATYPEGLCCVRWSLARRQASYEVCRKFDDVLYKKISPRSSAVGWNDFTPTPEVLAVLDDIAGKPKQQ